MRSTRKGRGPLRRAAFTIIELLVVLAIMLAIAGIIFPALAGRLATTQMRGASQAIASAVALTQAEASELGRARRLVAERQNDRWVLFSEDVSSADFAPANDEPPLEPEAPARRTELASFAGVDCTDTLPPIASDDWGMLAEAIPEESIDGPLERETERLVVCICFSDGSCRTSGALYLSDESGSRRVVRIEPLNGRVDVRPLPTQQDEQNRLDEPGLESPAPGGRQTGELP